MLNVHSILRKNSTPVILQTEATECSLACLAMISGHFGSPIDIREIRTTHPISSQGATLATLVSTARKIKMGARPLKLELEAVAHLKLPCILHWNFNHFVTLVKRNRHSYVIIDPASGRKEVSAKHFSECFTGIAVEFWPEEGFKQTPKLPPVPVRSMLGRMRGFSTSLLQIALLAIALEILSMTSPLYLQWVVDNVITSSDGNLLNILALGFGTLMILQQVLTACRSWLIVYMSSTLSVQWRSNVLGHLLKLPVPYFQRRHLGDTVSRFSSVEEIQRTVSTTFLETILDGLMSFATFSAMMLYNFNLALVAAASMLLYAAFRAVSYYWMLVASEEQIVHSARQQTHFIESIRGIKSIKLFGRQGERQSSWMNLFVRQVNSDIKVQQLVIWAKLASGTLLGASNVIVIWAGGYSVLNKVFSLGILTAFLAYKMQFDSRVGAFIDKVFDLKMLRLQAARLADIIQEEEEPDQRSADMTAPDQPPTVELVDLSFKYSQQDPFTLFKVNATFNSGECVAITGPSGCGKTTLLNVMLGVLPPSSGTVLIDGKPVSELGNEYVRSLIGTVLQDDVLFSGSIMDNIVFFDQQPDFAWARECTRLSAVSADIEKMPMGYDTLVGDSGSVLSGGQKQRIFLARALYKRPKILFLDEATSALDLAKEREVNCAIRSLNITRIIIAHRPDTTASADRVIHLQNGTVHEVCDNESNAALPVMA